jgi:NAD(P)H-hydrate epimerase
LFPTVTAVAESSLAMTIPTYQARLPELTTAQMVEVDRLMVEEYRIELVQMMENAGRGLAHLTRVRFLGGDPRGSRVVVMAGAGGNGGGALACARWLSNWGAEVWVVLTRPAEAFAGVPAHQLDILGRMGVPVAEAEAIAAIDPRGRTDVIVDGLIGYSLSGAPRGTAAQLIRWANGQSSPIVALDVPSGLDATSGAALEPAIRATATLTLALPKKGLRTADADGHVGELYLADVSVPPALYERSGIELDVGHVFAEGDIVRLS